MGKADYIRVVDYIISFAVPEGEKGLVTEVYTTREGDVVGENKKGDFMIRYAPRTVSLGGEKVDVEGDTVAVPREHIAAIRERVRYEPKAKRSAASYLNPDKAAVDELKQKHNVS